MSDIIDFVLRLHEGWRYLVMLETVATSVYFIYLLVTKATATPREAVMAKIWTIFVDAQILGGIILFVLYILDDAHEIKGQQIGHLFTMLLLVAPTVHFYSIYAKRNPDLKQLRMIGAVAPIVALVLMFVGIAALG